MNYRVRHSTRYTYSQPVAIAHNEVRLTPRSGGASTPAAPSSRSTRRRRCLSQQHDFFGNTIHFFTLQAPHHEMTVTAVSDVEPAERAAAGARGHPAVGRGARGARRRT